MLADIQHRFVQALRDDRMAAPADVVSVSGDRPARRFGIYRDNVAIGLSRALASRFPASVSIVGEEFFLAMARQFAALHPPRSPVLIGYGDALPAFVETFEPAREIPYLPDVLRLEVARAHAYHAADTVPLDASALAALAPDRIAQTRVTLHPSVGLVRSVHPVVTIWSMNSGILSPAPIDDWRGEDALVCRPQLDVVVHRQPSGGHAFLTALSTGATLAEAVSAALTDAPDFDAGGALAGLITAGVAVAFD